MDDLNSEHSWHLVCLAWFYALVLPLTICHKQVTIRSRAGKSLGWKRGGGGKKAGVLLTLAVDEGLCKTRAHSPRSSSRQFSLHSTRLSNTSCHKSLPALLSQPVTKLRLSHVSRWFEVTLWDIVLGLCAPHRWGESRQLCGQQGRPAAWEPRHRDRGHRCRPETEAISQPAPDFGRMSRICGLGGSLPNSLQYYTDGGRCHCCSPEKFFFFTISTCFLDVTLKLNISVLTPVFSTKYKYKRPEDAFSPPPKTLPKALLVDCPTQLICTWIFICVRWQS